MLFYQILELQELSTLTEKNIGQFQTEVKTYLVGMLELSGSTGVGNDGLHLGLECSEESKVKDSVSG